MNTRSKLLSLSANWRGIHAELFYVIRCGGGFMLSHFTLYEVAADS